MPENNTQPAPAVVSTETSAEPTPSRFKRFTQDHPRTTKIVTLTGAGLGLVAATSVVKNMQHNRKQLSEASDHAKEALIALSDSTATPDPQES